MRPVTGNGWKRKKRSRKRRDSGIEEKDTGPFKTGGPVFLCQ